MAAGVGALVYADQGGYIAREQGLLRQSIDNTDLANHEAEIKRNLTAEKEKEDDILSQRRTQFDLIRAQLTKTKAEVDALLTQQTAIETNLFEVQREIALTLDEVYKLQERLEARERELLGAKK
jgi:hypothetical protein